MTDTTSPAPLATAHALGIPIVATRREALPEAGGIVVPRRSARAIAEALHTLAQSPRYAPETLGRAAQGDLGRNLVERSQLAHLPHLLEEAAVVRKPVTRVAVVQADRREVALSDAAERQPLPLLVGEPCL